MAGARDLPSGTVTFLFSDIEGSTRLLKELGREPYGEVLAEHNSRLREAFAAQAGTEIDRQGDAFFFVFRSAGAAVAAAAAAQRSIAEAAWPEAGAVRVRMGLHTGEASVSADGYVGFAVHQAARIGDLGHGGQILVSRTTAALVEHELPPELELRSLGEARLPGLDRSEELFQLVSEGLPDRFPPLGARRPSVPAPQPDGPPLLERQAELAAIHAYVDAAASGAGRLVVIEARAGMGKTRLLAEARAAATQANLTVLTARGGELESEFAYGVVRQLFEQLLASATSQEREELLDGPAARAAALFEVGELDGADDDPSGVSFAVLHGLYWVAANLALRRPALIAIDDVHWADGPSLRWLSHLQRRLDGLPLLVVIATRPPAQSRHEQLMLEIIGDPAAAVVRPTALGPESVAALAREVFGREPAPEFVVTCHTATGGNPLFLEALLDTLRSEGLQPTAEHAPRVLEIGPEPVTRAVMLRLSRVPSEAVLLARALAVLGGHAELRHAAALAGLDPEVASHAATSLARAEVLRVELPLEFTHPVVRSAVYEDMSPPERIAAHRRAASVLAETQAEPEQVAVHLEQVLPTGDRFVIDTLRRAAERALQRGASDVAVGFLRRALDEPPPPEERGEVLRALGLAERLIDNDAAIVHLRDAIEELGESQRAGRLALELGRALQRGNQNREAIDVLRRGRDLVGDDPDMWQSMTAELIGAAWWDPADLPLAEAELARVREDELVDGYGGFLLRAILSYAESRVGDHREHALELAEAAMASGYLISTGSRALYSLGYTLTVAGRPDATIALFEQGYLEALRRGDYVLANGCVLFRALAHLHEGSLASAEEDLGRMADQVALQMATPYSAAFAAWIALERGDLEQAERILGAAGFPERIPSNGQFLFFHLVRGRLRFEQRQTDAAIQDLLTVGEHSRGLGHRNPAFMPWQPYAALALHAAGRTEEALEIALAAVDRARIWGAPRMTGVTLRTLGLIEGGPSGEKLLQEAVDILAGSSARLEYAKALVELGAALRRGNRRADARGHLRQGLELAHKLGATALESRAQTELAATGARPRRLMLTGLESLTPSERRVADMAAENMTNKDIAQALFVTPKTVEVHLSSVYRKLEISSRSQLPVALGATA
jgi:class 3 adenylate cyclase/DNA-binding CsgD family transcriptional regulator